MAKHHFFGFFKIHPNKKDKDADSDKQKDAEKDANDKNKGAQDKKEWKEKNKQAAEKPAKGNKKSKAALKSNAAKDTASGKDKDDKKAGDKKQDKESAPVVNIISNGKTVKATLTDGKDSSKPNDQDAKTDKGQGNSSSTELKKQEHFNAPTVLAKPIIIKFMHQHKKIANDYIFTGKLGEALNVTKIPPVEGYEFPNDSLNYSITDHTQVIPVEMKPRLINYRLVPVTENGKTISQKYIKSLNGQPGTPIVFSDFPNIPGYQAYTTRIYIVPDKQTDLQITYAPVQQTITVVFITTTGLTLGEQTMHGKTGDPYQVNPLEHHFEGYELIKDKLPKDLKGTFKPTDQLVSLKYKPVDSGVTVTFLDERGNAIHKPLTFSGAYGDTYSLTNLPVIDGYKLITNPSLLIGKYDVSPKQLVLKYKRAAQTVRIRYWFDKEHKISAGEDKTLSGLTDDYYKIQVPAMDGYHPDRQIISGQYKPFGQKTIDVVYSPIKTVVQLKLQDKGGRPLPNVEPLKQTGVYGEKYSFDLPEIPGYKRPQDSVSGTFKLPQDTIIANYSPRQATITVNYLDARNKKPIVGSKATTVNGLVGTAYSIEPKMIEGFKLQGMPKNAAGVYHQAQDVINFFYQPNKSKITIHQLDQAGNSIFPDFDLPGYYGDPYSIKPDELKGYQFISSNDKLKGTFPLSPKDICLYYKSQVISFTLAPVNQFNQVIDEKYNLKISGMVGQQFSNGLPKVPGYTAENSSSVGGTIQAKWDQQLLKIRYMPDDAQAVIHFACVGGPQDGATPFEDYYLRGKVADKYEYKLPDITGYHTQHPVVSGHFTPNEIEIDAIYEVNRITFRLHFIDDHGDDIVTTEEMDGTFGQTIDALKLMPKGYHLPSGSSNQVTLTDKTDYNVMIIPDSIIVNLVAMTRDGQDLDVQRQINGLYHHPQKLIATHINGYQPVNGNEITINFDLHQDTIPVIYEPEDRQITVRYITTQGNNLASPDVVNGRYEEPYRISAKKFDGFVVINNETMTGKFGLNNTDLTFIYRAASDEISPAITPLSDILINNNDNSNDDNQDNSIDETADNTDNSAYTSTDTPADDSANTSTDDSTDTPSSDGSFFDINQDKPVQVNNMQQPDQQDGSIKRILHKRN